MYSLSNYRLHFSSSSAHLLPSCDLSDYSVRLTVSRLRLPTPESPAHRPTNRRRRTPQYPQYIHTVVYPPHKYHSSIALHSQKPCQTKPSKHEKSPRSSPRGQRTNPWTQHGIASRYAPFLPWLNRLTSTHFLRPRPSPLETSGQAWLKYTKQPLKDEVRKNVELSSVVSKNPWPKAACSSASP